MMLKEQELRKQHWERLGHDSIGNYRIVCLGCQTECFKKHPTAKYCSINCQEKHRYEKIKAARQQAPLENSASMK
jgi:hypothetical protein